MAGSCPPFYIFSKLRGNDREGEAISLSMKVIFSPLIPEVDAILIVTDCLVALICVSAPHKEE
jgi:hypothetical protein